MTTATQASWVSRIATLQDSKSYAELNWEGSFEDYLHIVRDNPKVTRTAFQRIYDMILSHGKTEYIDNKKKLIRYHFFHDEKFGGRDAIFGLDVPLMKLVNVFKSAAQGYGTEKRVILLHGPVGSSKSTIARLLKKGIEEYSRTPEGATLHVLLAPRQKGRRRHDGKRDDALPDERGAAAPHPARLAHRRSSQALGRQGHDFQVPETRRSLPCLPLRLPGPDDPERRRLGQGGRAHPCAPADALREGPHRHRHLPAEGREEPGLHRAHRRHQLPEDRRVRLRLATRGPSTSTASSTSPTAASSSSSRC